MKELRALGVSDFEAQEAYWALQCHTLILFLKGTLMT